MRRMVFQLAPRLLDLRRGDVLVLRSLLRHLDGNISLGICQVRALPEESLLRLIVGSESSALMSAWDPQLFRGLKRREHRIDGLLKPLHRLGLIAPVPAHGGPVKQHASPNRRAGSASAGDVATMNCT